MLFDEYNKKGIILVDWLDENTPIYADKVVNWVDNS